MKYMSHILLVILLAAGMGSCNIINPEHDPITYGESYIPHQLATDKAAYRPGEAVTFALNAIPQNGASVRYTHLGTTIEEEPVTSLSWTWLPPSDDYQGYMATLYGQQDGRDTVYASVGIDVSSDPARFPRNGFLSSYGNLSAKEIAFVMDDLNRYHINYVQFQDWHWKHHHPLGGSAAQPMDVWTDIISRNCYRSTVQGYIDAAHKRGMVTLFYNLLYGALEDYETDGVSREWMLYKNKNHTDPDNHPLGSPFKSAIYLANPHNQAWRDYLRARNDEVYAVFDFDGWQIDQLGSRGTVYDYNGSSVDIASAFGSAIANEKTAQPGKRIVMNAVGQYGQQGQIASAPVDFCYTEVWEHNDETGYTVFSDYITNNAAWSGGKQTVLAAYLNYNHGRKGRGYFNTPGILMATAAASAWGGTILQMGEHMLCHEYFPGDNLTMTGELKRAMINYYDFAVAYENLLRPDIPATGINSDWYGVDVQSKDGECVFNQWGPKRNQVATIGRHVGSHDIIHLLSYRNATHLDWCDTNANQNEPDKLTNLHIALACSAQPKRVWVASPDDKHGAPQEVEWDYSGGQLSLTLPALHYWTMIVLEK